MRYERIRATDKPGRRRLESFLQGISSRRSHIGDITPLEDKGAKIQTNEANTDGDKASAVQTVTTSREKRVVPRVDRLARSNLLSLFWDKPIASLTTETGKALPGFSLPEDRTQTLGSFLTGGDPELQTFDDFRTQVASEDKSKVRKVLSGLKNICPDPKEAFVQNPHLLNWVPWETYIAYGDVLKSQKDHGIDQKIAGVVLGDSYLAQARETFPDGHPTKRTEIVLERQNKDPRTQGILEAVSNSVDAISDREKIGQFGLGVKQVLTWLENGRGEVQVLSKAANGDALSFHARKGHDGQVYVKFDPPSAQLSTDFKPEQTGTVIKLTDVAIDTDRQKELSARLHEQFRYVPEAKIAINGEDINGHESIKVVGRTATIIPQGKIDVTLADSGIEIRDTGSGMDQQTMFRMFLPGYGKGYKALSPAEARTIAQNQAEVSLIEEENPRIVFSRNREVDFAISVPKDRVNTSSQTICLELGKILKVSEGRDGFEIDENFATAVPILVTKTLGDTSLSDAEKTSFLNSLILGVDQLTGTAEQADDKMGSIIKKTKAGIRQAAKPFISQLRDNGTVLLPNYVPYQRIAQEAQFVDPFLMRGLGDIDKVLQSEGLQRLQKDEGVTTKGGWKVLAAPLEQTSSSQDLATQVQQKETLISVRAQLEEVLPVIIDKEHRIVIVDQKLWQAIESQPDPVRKAYLQESVQAIINDKVFTSYEKDDPRAIRVHDAQRKQETAAGVASKLTDDEGEALSRPWYQSEKKWFSGDVLYTIDASGVMKRYDRTTKELLSSTNVTEPDEGAIYSQPTEQGIWLLNNKGSLSFVANDGTQQEKFTVPDVNTNSYGDQVSVSQDGRVLIASGFVVKIIDPRTQKTEVYESPSLGQIYSPYLTSDNKLFYLQNKVISMVDRSNGTTASSMVDEVPYMAEGMGEGMKFFTFNNQVYVAGIDARSQEIGLYALETKQGLISSFHLGFMKVPYMNMRAITLTAESDSGTIGIQAGSTYTFLHMQNSMAGMKVEHLESCYSPVANFVEETASATAALKELFGDDLDTSYGLSVLTIRDQLKDKPLEALKAGPLRTYKTEQPIIEANKPVSEHSYSIPNHETNIKNKNFIAGTTGSGKSETTDEEIKRIIGIDEKSRIRGSARIIRSHGEQVIFNINSQEHPGIPKPRVSESRPSIIDIGRPINRASEKNDKPKIKITPQNNKPTQHEIVTDAISPTVLAVLEGLRDRGSDDWTPQEKDLILDNISKAYENDKDKKERNQILGYLKAHNIPLFGESEISAIAAPEKLAPAFPEGSRTQRFVNLISSEQFKEVFAPVWEMMKDEFSKEDQERLKLRFVRNAPLLLDTQGDSTTPEMIQLMFFSDNPQTFFDQSGEHVQKITGMLAEIDSISQKEGFVKLATLLCRGKTHDELESFDTQLTKLFARDNFKQDFLRLVTEHGAELPKAIQDPTKLDISNPLRAYLLFVTSEAELLRTEERIETSAGYTAVLPTTVPLELLAHFRLTEGHFTIDEVRQRIQKEGGLEKVLAKYDLSHYQDEIRKAIHAQSVEPGVAKRELLQNALFAIRAKGSETGTVAVDFYLRNNGREYVEEIRDSGTGIENLISFLVPGATTKDGSDGLGIFGTGFYKALEDVDQVEVASVTAQNKSLRIIIDVIKDENGIVQGGVVREIMEKSVTGKATGTSIKLVKHTQGQLPELDAMIAKNTYLTMGGLATLPEVADGNVEFSFINEQGATRPVSIAIADHSVAKVDGVGAIQFIKAPSLPSAMTTVGLRMSPLAQVSSDYLKDVPEVLKTFLTDEHISVVLPRTVPLVKDRSRIASEEAFLPGIQQAVATEAIKRTAYALLNDEQVKVRGFVPEDILSNSRYYKIVTSDEGKEAYTVAQKINNGSILTQDDLNYINSGGNNDNLLLVLLGIEQTAANGNKDSLLRRFQYIQEKSGNTKASQSLTQTLHIDAEKTAITPRLVAEQSRLVPQIAQSRRRAETEAAIDASLLNGEKPKGVTSLAESDLDAQEKELLTQYFTNIGFETVLFVDSKQLDGASGSTTGRRIFLNDDLLHMSPRERWETIGHESAHVFENREHGITDGVLDTEKDRKSDFTHQQEGPFAQHYKLAAHIMQNQLAA